MSKVKKKGGGARKGSAFEREICKRLSLWWSKGKYDDLFWRTAGSGARATTRARTNQRTKNSYGDIQALSMADQDLLKFFTFELKTGYAATNIQELLDVPLNVGRQPPLFEQWFNSAEKDAELARSMSWAVISKRKGRVPLIWFPIYTLNQLNKDWDNFQLWIRVQSHDLSGEFLEERMGVPLEDFLSEVTPSEIKEAVERWKKRHG